MLKTTLRTIITSTVLLSTAALSDTVRYSEIGTQDIISFLKDDTEKVVEFRAGDVLHVGASIQGDVLRALSNPVAEVLVEKTFYLKLGDRDPLLSWDGYNFLPLADQLTGKVSASIGHESELTSIIVNLEAYKLLP